MLVEWDIPRRYPGAHQNPSFTAEFRAPRATLRARALLYVSHETARILLFSDDSSGGSSILLVSELLLRNVRAPQVRGLRNARQVNLQPGKVHLEGASSYLTFAGLHFMNFSNIISLAPLNEHFTVRKISP